MLTVDYFGDLDQQRLCETHSLRERGLGYSPAAILEVARTLSYDAVVYCGGLENHPDVVAELARDRVLLGNAPETLRRVREPIEQELPQQIIHMSTPSKKFRYWPSLEITFRISRLR